MEKNPPNIAQLVYKALIFDFFTYDYVKKKNKYIKHSLLIVIIGSLAAGFGTYSFTNHLGILKQLISSVLSWLLISALIYIIGVRIFNYDSEYKTLLRTIGLAYSPMLLNIFAFIPYVGSYIIIISTLWLFFTTIYAVKHTLNSSKFISLIIILLAIIPYIMIPFLIIR
ncbi:MAG: hypothetical protein GTO02_18885 [Candidatus Dadabacteria bacterium]|nr:hypothetical protein [Candidatus Dadabacteria bacterium]NIQ16376.1 hypothetical protein [Candidatus Dadabacteria bacterium]